MTLKIRVSLMRELILLISIAAVVLYFICPEKYDMILCIVAAVLYAAVFILYIIEVRMRNFFCFSFIFSIVWFFVYYLYPTVVYPINKNYYFMFAFNFNENIMTKATYLSLIGYCAFIGGLLTGHVHSIHKRKNYEIVIKSNLVPTIVVGLFCVIDFIQFVVLNMGIYYGEGNSDPTATDLYSYISLLKTAAIITAIAIEFHILMRKNNGQRWYLRNPILWLLVVVDAAILLYSGYRGEVLSVCLTILAGVTLYSDRISFFKITGLMVVGFILLNFVLQWRNGQSLSQISMSIDILSVSSDLVINNYTLYKGYDYVQSSGLLPFTLIGSLLSAIPFLQGIIISIFDISLFQTSSARFFSYLTMGEQTSFGVGTNIIAGLYLGLGFVGVILMMFVLGRFVKKYSEDAPKKSLYGLLMHFMIMMQAVYWVRGDYFFPVNKIVYSLLFMWLYTLFLGKKVRSKE